MRNLGLLSGCLAVVGCSGDKATASTSEPPSDATVLASADARFSPGLVSVPVGGVVLWRFQGTAHNVTFTPVSGVPSDIGGSNANTSIARTFNSPGTFAYACTFHEGMSGTVQVVQGANPPPPPSPPPGDGDGYP